MASLGGIIEMQPQATATSALVRPVFAREEARADTREARLSSTWTDGSSDTEPAPAFAHSSGPVGPLVCMADALRLPKEAFTISHECLGDLVNVRSYDFTRDVKKSMLLRYGIYPEMMTQSRSTQDIYIKNSNESSETLFLSVTVGIGMLDLSRAMAKCGYLCGLPVLFCFAAINLFLCRRLTEIPTLFQRNFGTFGDIALASFGRFGYGIAVTILTLYWLGMCAVHLTTAIVMLETGPICNGRPCIVWWQKILCLAFFLPHVFHTTKHEHTYSVVSLYTMCLIAALEMVCSLVHAFELHGVGTPTGEPQYSFIGEDWFSGVRTMMLAFNGVAVLPYVVSDMMTPQDARHVVTTACAKKTAIYIPFCIICYIGWGSRFKRSTIEEELFDLGRNGSGFYWWSSILMNLLLAVKAIASFPLYFWPLCQEVESVLAFADHPALRLRLPWAITQVRRQTVSMNVGLLLLAFLPSCSPQTNLAHQTIRELVSVTNNLVQFCLPSLFAACAIFAHARLVRDAVPRKSSSTSWEIPASAAVRKPRGEAEADAEAVHVKELRSRSAQELRTAAMRAHELRTKSRSVVALSRNAVQEHEEDSTIEDAIRADGCQTSDVADFSYMGGSIIVHAAVATTVAVAMCGLSAVIFAEWLFVGTHLHESMR